MKPTSIIFLIVAAVLVITGFVTAGIAKQLAVSEGIELVASVSDESENYIYTYQYDSDNIAKISVNVRNANVNIIGGSTKPYIEIINFSEGLYEFSSSNRILSINDSTDFTSLSGITSIATNFKGLRSFVNYFKLSGLEKTVNIYLSPDYPVNVVDCSVGAGEVNIKESLTSTDYNVDIAAGKLTVENITTTSALGITVDAGSVSIKDSTVSKMTATVSTGSMSIDATIDRIDANISTGDFVYSYRGSLDLTNLKLFTNVGKIVIDSEQFGGYRETNAAMTDNSIHVNIGVGDIEITSAAG